MIHRNPVLFFFFFISEGNKTSCFSSSESRIPARRRLGDEGSHPDSKLSFMHHPSAAFRSWRRCVKGMMTASQRQGRTSGGFGGKIEQRDDGEMRSSTPHPWGERDERGKKRAVCDPPTPHPKY